MRDEALQQCVEPRGRIRWLAACFALLGRAPVLSDGWAQGLASLCFHGHQHTAARGRAHDQQVVISRAARVFVEACLRFHVQTLNS